ncbi:hypothetical protein JCM33774_86820 [Actinophytocola sp. KF-1]
MLLDQPAARNTDMAVTQLDALPVYPCTNTTGVVVAAFAVGVGENTENATTKASTAPMILRMKPSKQGWEVGTHSGLRAPTRR